MGCNSSRFDSAAQARRVVQLQAFQKLLSSLKISQSESEILYNIYDKADISRDGFISVEEFLRMCKIPSSPYSLKLFQLFDKNGNGELDFGEWIASLWLFLSSSRAVLAKLSFYLIQDGNGQVSSKELTRVFTQIHRGHVETDEFFAQLSAGTLGMVSHFNEQQFIQFSSKYPAVLYPATFIQRDLMINCGGEKFWMQIAARRGSMKETMDFQMFIIQLRKEVADGTALEEAMQAMEKTPGSLDEQTIQKIRSSNVAAFRDTKKVGRKTGRVASGDRNTKTSATGGIFHDGPRKTKPKKASSAPAVGEIPLHDRLYHPAPASNASSASTSARIAERVRRLSATVSSAAMVVMASNKFKTASKRRVHVHPA